MAIYQLGDDAPRIAPGAWIAENATVLGRVELAEGSNIWYGSVLRGDNDWIRLGRNVNIQDACVLHTDHGFPMWLADGVSVGHQAMLHGCTVGEGSLIGIQSVVLNGAKIGKHCIVGAGAVVTEGKEFPDGSMILGAPARVARMLTPEQVERLARISEHYVENAARHRQTLKRIA